MTDVNPTAVEEAPEQGQISFDYVKSPNWRVIHSDGTYGGVTPRGKIMAAIFNERFAIPRHVVYEFHDGTLGNELDSVHRSDIIRELEVGIIWDLQGAKLMREWLDEQITELEALTAATGKGGK